jgi:hypothetical protein
MKPIDRHRAYKLKRHLQLDMKPTTQDEAYNLAQRPTTRHKGLQRDIDAYNSTPRHTTQNEAYKSTQRHTT